MGLPFANESADSGMIEHDLKRGYAARTVRLGNELLRDDRHQNHRELQPDLLLLIGGEYVHHTVNGIRRANRVQGAHDQVTRLCGGDSGRDGFKVTHFAHLDDVGVLTKGGAKRCRKGARIIAYFTLIDNALDMVVIILDRVLEGDDMCATMIVDIIYHRGEGRRLTAAGRTGDEDDAPALIAEIEHRIGKSERGERRYHAVDGTDSDGIAAFLTEGVDTETVLAERNCNVHFAELLELLPICFVKDIAAHLLGIFGRERCGLKIAEGTGHTQNGRRLHGNMKVGSFLLESKFQEFFDGNHVYPLYSDSRATFVYMLF